MDTAPPRNPLRRPSGSEVGGRIAPAESRAHPTVARLVGAALGLPVDHFISNVEPELQAESDWHEGLSEDQAFQQAVDCLYKLHELRLAVDKQLKARERYHGDDRPGADGQPSAHLQKQQLAQRNAEKRVRDSLYKFHQAAAEEDRFMASYRGAAGETIAHTACLLRLYDVLFLILDMEPMVISEAYEGSKYKGETILHMLCSHGSIVTLRRLARRALFPHESAVRIGPCDGSGSAAGILARAWARLYAYDMGPSPSAPLTSDWCRSWLRAAWCSLVSSRCVGSFFQPPPDGACGYGSTALGFAAVLSHVAIVRFLVVEVGCLARGLWADIDRGEAAEREAGVIRGSERATSRAASPALGPQLARGRSADAAANALTIEDDINMYPGCVGTWGCSVQAARRM